MQSYTIPTNIRTTKQCLHEAYLMKSKQDKLTKENGMFEVHDHVDLTIVNIY